MKLLFLLKGIPGIRDPLLEEFGVRLVTYDLPGFGDSDPHPNRSLNSSALDMLYLANAVAIKWKVLGFGILEWSYTCLGCLKVHP